MKSVLDEGFRELGAMEEVGHCDTDGVIASQIKLWAAQRESKYGLGNQTQEHSDLLASDLPPGTCGTLEIYGYRPQEREAEPDGELANAEHGANRTKDGVG